MEYVICNNDNTAIELYHYGIKGQKWGIRRFQDANGRLTDEGKRRYGSKPTKYGKMAYKNAQKAASVKKMFTKMKKQSDKRMERQYRKGNDKKYKKEKEMNERITNVIDALSEEYKENLGVASKYASPRIQRKILNTRIDAVKLEKRMARKYDSKKPIPILGAIGGAVYGAANASDKLDYARDITNTRKGTRYNKWLTKG